MSGSSTSLHSSVAQLAVGQKTLRNHDIALQLNPSPTEKCIIEIRPLSTASAAGVAHASRASNTRSHDPHEHCHRLRQIPASLSMRTTLYYDTSLLVRRAFTCILLYTTPPPDALAVHDSNTLLCTPPLWIHTSPIKNYTTFLLLLLHPVPPLSTALFCGSNAPPPDPCLLKAHLNAHTSSGNSRPDQLEPKQGRRRIDVCAFVF